jgi:hypothetical protein
MHHCFGFFWKRFASFWIDLVAPLSPPALTSSVRPLQKKATRRASVLKREEKKMPGDCGLSGRNDYRSLMPAAAVTTAVLLVGSGALAAACQGPGAPSTTQTECLTAVQIPGNPLGAFDVGWVDPDRAEYYLADRSNAGVDIIDTDHNAFKRRIGGFVGARFNANGTVNNNISGPNGVTSHGRWLYAGDGPVNGISTFRVIDLNAPSASATKQIVSTGGTQRVDKIALTPDGHLVIANNTSDDPPFATLFVANGDGSASAVNVITKISVDPTIVPPGFGLGIKSPTWEPRTQRFYVSIPTIADNPSGCNYGQLAGDITCSGGLLVIDPTTLSGPTAVIGAFDPATNTGVLPVNECGPFGITVGPHFNLLQGCTQSAQPSNTSTLVINAITKHFANIGGITGSNEVWFNGGDDRYYTGSSHAIGGAVLGVIDAETNLLIETIPQSAASNSVAADSRRNRIFVPQAAPVAVVGPSGDTTTVGAEICGTNNGCIAVYSHDVDEENAYAEQGR